MALGIGQMLGGLMIGQMSGLLGEQKPEEQKQILNLYFFPVLIT